MAKGLRSKIKKQNRAVMRATIGKDFQDKVLKQVTTTMKLQHAKEKGTSEANLRLACAALGGDLNVQKEEDEESVEEGEDFDMGGEEDGSSDPSPKGGLNAVPRRVAQRGTKNTRKYHIPVVKRDDGAIVQRGKRRGRLPGVGSRSTVGKPKQMVSF